MITFYSSISALASLFDRSSKVAKPRSTRRLSRLQLLESRVVPAAVIWTGDGNDLNWNDPSNWKGGSGVPGVNDSVTIGTSGITITELGCTDLGIFGTTFGLNEGEEGFIPGFDSDGNGVIDNTDLLAFGTRFGLTI